MFKRFKEWKSDLKYANRYYSLSNKERHKLTRAFGKHLDNVRTEAEKLQASEDYATHVLGMKKLMAVRRLSERYERSMRYVILMELWDDRLTFIKLTFEVKRTELEKEEPSE